MQIIWHINQSKASLLKTVFTLLPSCSEGSPHLPTLSNYMFWREHVVRLGRLEQGKKGRKGREWEREWALKQQEHWSKTNPVEDTPPPQSDEHLCLPPPPSPSLGFFHPLHYSLACCQSRAHSSSCRSSRCAEPLPPALLFPPSGPGHGESKLDLFCCWNGNWAPIKLLS